MERFNSTFALFLSLMVQAMPFLLIGVFFSGILTFFVSERQLLRWMPKNPLLGSLFGSCIGFLFPVCECGNIPVARRLMTQGAPASVSIGFLIASPTINPIVFWATWTAFRDQPEIVFLRIGLSLAIATLMGCLFSLQSDLSPFLQPSLVTSLDVRRKREQVRSAENLLLSSGTFFLGKSNTPLPTDDAQAMNTAMMEMVNQPIGLRIKLLVEGMAQELRELSAVLILGSLVAAAIQSFVPREVVLSLGQDPVTSIVAMMTLAALVSICSTVDSFFAMSFASSFTTGSLVSFLVFGPMIDLKAIGLLLTMFKPRAIFYLFAVAGLLTFLAALVLNLFF
jgi:hypothetical protein